MTQAEVRVEIYGSEKPTHRLRQVQSLEEIKIGDRYKLRCDLPGPGSPNPYLDTSLEELVQVLQEPQIINSETWLRVHKTYIYHDTGRMGEYDQTISLADQGLVPDQRGLWNQVNWLEKLEPNPSHS